jgi:hypothetical protein
MDSIFLQSDGVSTEVRAVHQELDVLLIRLATFGSEETADQEVQEREQHGAPSGRGERTLTGSGPRIGEIEPFTITIPTSMLSIIPLSFVLLSII